mgnify:CR=1 FL=1
MSAKKNMGFKIGEIVVYPKHGVGEIINTETMEISSIKTTYYVVKMEQAKLTIRVPLDKQEEVGLRKISSKKIIEDVFTTLKLKPKIRRIMWSRRAQEYDTKIFSEIDLHFEGIFKDYDKSLFNGSIKVKKHNEYSRNPMKNILITMNSIKTNSSGRNKVQIFSI